MHLAEIVTEIRGCWNVKNVAETKKMLLNRDQNDSWLKMEKG